jgi:TonB family protein
MKIKSSPLGGGPMEVIETTTLTLAKMNEPLPESLFVFAPPAGAKEVEEINFPGMNTKRVNWSGKEAVAFTLKDLDGKPVDLQGLKGQVVLLNFWASWCGPCVAELPYIEKLHREFKDKGLVVLGVNDEEIEVARQFMKEKGYTFTSLVDEGKETAQRYEIQSIPQVLVIGRGGKIVSHTFGYSEGREGELRATVERALSGDETPASGSPAGSGSGVTSTSGDNQLRPKLIKVSGDVLQGSAINRVQPDYPPIAKAAHASGKVQVVVTVSEEGKVTQTEVISGHPLLRDAALKAAGGWTFKPTELSGVPVKVQGILSFNFTPQ